MPPHFTKDEWFVEVEETDGSRLPDTPILTVTVNDDDEINNFQYKIIESSGYGADKFGMTKNADGTGSLKVIHSLDYEDPMQMNGFRFRIQVKDDEKINDNDKNHVAHSWVIVKLKDINDNTVRDTLCLALPLNVLNETRWVFFDIRFFSLLSVPCITTMSDVKHQQQ